MRRLLQLKATPTFAGGTIISSPPDPRHLAPVDLHMKRTLGMAAAALVVSLRCVAR